MAILFSACEGYSVMHVFVCLLEQYNFNSVVGNGELAHKKVGILRKRLRTPVQL